MASKVSSRWMCQGFRTRKQKNDHACPLLFSKGGNWTHHFSTNWINKNIDDPGRPTEQNSLQNSACKRRFCLRSSVCALWLQKEIRLVPRMTGFVEVGLIICWCVLAKLYKYNFFAKLGLVLPHCLAWTSTWGPSSLGWGLEKLGPQTVSNSSSACRCSSRITNYCHRLKQHHATYINI